MDGRGAVDARPDEVDRGGFGLEDHRQGPAATLAQRDHHAARARLVPGEPAVLAILLLVLRPE
jgi:hypothetical protein